MDGVGGQLHTLLFGGCMCKIDGVGGQLHAHPAVCGVYP